MTGPSDILVLAGPLQVVKTVRHLSLCAHYMQQCGLYIFNGYVTG